MASVLSTLILVCVNATGSFGSPTSRLADHASYVLPPTPGSAPFPTCPAYGVIGSRGSGESEASGGWDLGLGPPGLAFAVALGKLLPGVQYTANGPPAYPAVGASTVATNKQVYLDSVRGGAIQLVVMVRVEHAKCPSTKMFVVGYSQGAELTADAYLSEVEDKAVFNSIAGVVLFGDPLYNHNDSATGQTALQEKTQTALTQNGILTMHGPLHVGAPHSFPRSTISRVLSYCIAKDPICQGVVGNSITNGEHSLYTDVGDPEDAAQWFTDRMMAPVANTPASPGTSTIGDAPSLVPGHTYSLDLRNPPVSQLAAPGETQSGGLCPMWAGQWWRLSLQAGDRVTVSWVVSPPSTGYYQYLIFTPDTNDANVTDRANNDQQAQFVNSSSTRGSGTFSAPTSGVYPFIIGDGCPSTSGAFRFVVHITHP